MARYGKRRVTTVTVEYELPTPTNYVEVEKLMSGVHQDLKAEGIPFSDDLVTVRTDDEKIVFSYEQSRSTGN